MEPQYTINQLLSKTTLPEEITTFLRNNAKERFIRYVKINTQSSEESETTPTTKEQFELGKLLKTELEELGVEDITHDEYNYVYGTIPATPGYEETEKNNHPIGLISHMDTSPAESGKDVEPRIIERYQGGIIDFPKNPDITIDPEIDSKDLKMFIGEEIITSSGNTLLGADDKSGIAEIMAVVEAWKKFPNKLVHPKVVVCFTPDEEVGGGTKKINLSKLPKVCYTIDGGAIGELSNECFDAWRVEFEFAGKDVHPGYGKGVMVNSIEIACKFFSQIPESQTPQNTNKREGYFHIYNFSGSVECTKVTMIIRDFEEEKNQRKIKFLESLVKAFEYEYFGLKINMKITHQYKNMVEYLKPHPEIVDKIYSAMKKAGLDKVINNEPIRGGTDGSNLSTQGVLTPNIFAGGYLFHSKREWIPTINIQKAAEVIALLSEEWADQKKD
ncbi:peptidase t [Anaeramoeba ignava]|uniref:Peptidase t n=1 Tax=Anaeramoeba ignava TaxID=1746090 RepID=A0A9Q0RB74_ANAIG|nr:peptidase t [Anaeramoeba ignava]|eukprot:Anaeramoba_ignava/a349451_175.p1 GENE.a349451_175~~a349451_175.p1  ORF type:complete len:444 (+),score=111.55 a349451_175:31-1362(+)